MKLPGIKKLVRFKTTTSTQDAAKALAEKGAPHKTLVWADRQTAGRGRLARKWKSPRGGLYFSLILRPKTTPARLGPLSVATGEAGVRALGAFGISCRVKLPNDILAAADASGPFRKIGGILSEARGDSKGLDWMVIGVGLNINNKPGLKRATSLKTLTGKTSSPAAVLKRFLKEFDKSYREFLHGL